MKRNIAYLLLSMMLALAALPVRADLQRKYTKEHPIVIVSDWDFPPYEFLGDNGKPNGYNIDLLSIILNKLELPFVFVLNNWQSSLQKFGTEHATLIVSLADAHEGRNVKVVTSKLPLHYYRLAVVTRKNDPPLGKIENLSPDSGILVVKKGDYAATYVEQQHINANIEYHTPKEALTGVANKKYKYFIWGEEPLKRKLETLHFETLRLDTIDIPVNRLFIVGSDQELISAIDDQYARLRQQGELQLLLDKWFHPETKHDNTSFMAVVAVLCICLLVLIVFMLSRLIRIRVKRAVERSTDINHMMTQALGMGDYLVFVHDLESETVTNVYGHLLPEGGVTMERYIELLHPDDRALYHENLRKVKSGQQIQPTINWRMNTGTDQHPVWQHLVGRSTIERELGKPRFIVNTVKNITQEMEEEQREREIGVRFFQLFDTNLLAMSFYNPDGQLVNYNEKMKQLCHIDNRNESYFRTTSLFDVAMLKGDLLPGATDEHFFCQHMDYPNEGIDCFIEIKVVPYFDEAGQLAYYVVTVRDISSERQMYVSLQQHEKELQQTSNDITRYERELSFLLKSNDMFTFHTSNEEQMIYFSQSSQDTQFKMSYQEYYDCLSPQDREQAMHNLSSSYDSRKPLNTIHHYNRLPFKKEPSWYTISATPIVDKEGRQTGFFGVVRDITKLMEANEQLRKETKRAENSGLQKSAFLANMTHEIRTPLNAIVGFSDLLPMIDTAEEKQEFIRIIRNNCDMLLRLINDILEASDMESKPLSIEPTDIDFAQTFDDICQTLAQRVQEPGVEFIKDNPYSTFRTHLDKGRMQQVITNFVTNAVKYTHQGHIRVGYRYEDGGIYMYCEDTGAGIPKEKQESVFDRFVKLNDFVQGTGLGLSICKSIANRCGGKIGVDSQGEGHGSTFWIWVPCPQL